MPKHAADFMRSLLLASTCAAIALTATATSHAAPPDFAPSRDIGWYAYTRMFIPPASGPGPVQQDRSRPYVSNDDFRVTGQQPTERVADLDNPILQPWAREVIRKRNEEVLSGHPPVTPNAACWPKGVTGFVLAPMTQPMYVIQGQSDVAMILSGGGDVRHIYLADQHSPRIKTSWYGESIGRYEGDALVVDTIGLDDRTWLDGFGTPHTKALHVVERYHLIENGQVLEANVHVEDPGAFTTPWNAIQRYRQFEAAVRKVPIERLAQLASAPEGPLTEIICAENPHSFFEGVPALPVPQAAKPDF